MTGVVRLTEDNITLCATQGAPSANTLLKADSARSAAGVDAAERILSDIATAQMHGADYSNGTISASKIGGRAAGRLRSRGAFLCDGKCKSCSSR